MEASLCLEEFGDLIVMATMSVKALFVDGLTWQAAVRRTWLLVGMPSPA